MAPKKGDGGKKNGGKKKKGDKEPNEEEPTDGKLMEIDKAFYELQMGNLKKRIEKLRADNTQITKDHSDMRRQYEQLETDRADVIAFLKLSLQMRTDEVQELQDRLRAMQQERAEEVASYEQRIVQMQDEFKNIQDQLKSEITIYAGKINSLEEFRLERENLTRKFEEQEREKNEMEASLRQRIDVTERKMIEDKHRLKRDVDRHLAQLRVDFEATYDLRMDATVKRLIQENIATNREYNELIEELEKLENRLKESREKEKMYRLKYTLAEDAHKLLVEKYTLQIDIIGKLTNEFRNLKEYQQEIGSLKREIENQERKIVELQSLNEAVEKKYQALEESAKIIAVNEKCKSDEVEKLKCDLEHLKKTTHECGNIIQKALGLRKSDDEIERCITSDELFNTLLRILNMAELHPLELDTLEMKTIYKKGDLGFVPPEPKASPQRKVTTEASPSTGSKVEFLSVGGGSRYRPFSARPHRRELKSAPIIREEEALKETSDDDDDVITVSTLPKVDIVIMKEDDEREEDGSNGDGSTLSSNVSKGNDDEDDGSLSIKSDSNEL